MTVCERHEDIEFGGPATYRIIVQGRVNERWHKRLDGLVVAGSLHGQHLPKQVILDIR